ncbi:MKRN2 opposite strand protein [Oratosquilla oratoria]|uniref:MKRN2 opposite strand protein n=1 Tax=Oratosquilla oratoria TaxID=337810 RepID=UPI003F7610EF
MNLDPGILCFQHCTGRLFSFRLPALCVFCKADLATDPLLVPPFRLPFPFVRGSQAPCCILIKPSKGDFLHDYRNSDDLHIGITSSEGVVYEYDQEGLHTDYTSAWSQCLAVPIIQDTRNSLDPVWQEYWDFTLHTLVQETCWTEERYDEKKFNCYSFVLAFLHALRPPGIAIKELDKTYFCKKFIVPHTTTAAKYISLYRKLQHQEVLAVT